MRGQMAELKTALYAKFGNSINLGAAAVVVVTRGRWCGGAVVWSGLANGGVCWRGPPTLSSPWALCQHRR